MFTANSLLCQIFYLSCLTANLSRFEALIHFFPATDFTLYSHQIITFYSSIQYLKMFSLRKECETSRDSSRDLESSEQLLEKDESSYTYQFPPESTSRAASYLKTCLLMTCVAIASAILGAWANHAGRLDADAFSIQHISQYCKLSRCKTDIFETVLNNSSSNC